MNGESIPDLAANFLSKGIGQGFAAVRVEIVHHQVNGPGAGYYIATSQANRANSKADRSGFLLAFPAKPYRLAAVEVAYHRDEHGPSPFMVERGHDDGATPDEWVAFAYAKVRRFTPRWASESNVGIRA